MIIYLCLKIFFPIGHHCKIQSEFSDLLEQSRSACSSYTVIINGSTPGTRKSQLCPWNWTLTLKTDSECIFYLVFFSWDPSPSIRMNFYGVVFGNALSYASVDGHSQASFQRYNSQPTLGYARKFVFFCLFYLTFKKYTFETLKYDLCSIQTLNGYFVLQRWAKLQFRTFHIFRLDHFKYCSYGSRGFVHVKYL